MTKELAQDVLTHLIDTNQEYCFLPNGEFVTRENCIEILEGGK